MESRGHMTTAREIVKKRDSPVRDKELERNDQRERVQQKGE